MSANERQVGGEHYRKIPGEQHWDRAVRLKLDFFQYMITKYIERCRDKNGLQDVEKALHFCEKYKECFHMLYPMEELAATIKAMAASPEDLAEGLMASNAALDWLCENMLLTASGTIKLPDGSVVTCLKGSKQDFTFEGAYGDGRTLWTCTHCRAKLHTMGEVLPHAVHKCGEEKAVHDGKRDEPPALDAVHVYEHKGEKRCMTCDQLAVPAACVRTDCPHKPRAAVATYPGGDLIADVAVARERTAAGAIAQSDAGAPAIVVP